MARITSSKTELYTWLMGGISVTFLSSLFSLLCLFLSSLALVTKTLIGLSSATHWDWGGWSRDRSSELPLSLSSTQLSIDSASLLSVVSSQMAGGTCMRYMNSRRSCVSPLQMMPRPWANSRNVIKPSSSSSITCHSQCWKLEKNCTVFECQYSKWGQNF